jgi:hypothetical protein
MNEAKDFQELKPGDSHYKAYVGPPNKYDLVGSMQFNLLTNFGLRDYHKLLDIGCGSLRSGKLMIPHLKEGNYYGIEPNKWLIEEGIKHELGNDIIEIKKPVFDYNSEFNFKIFKQKFDFLIAQSIFSHTSVNQINMCLEEAKIVMKPESMFFATFVLGEENYLGKEWVYPGCVTYKHSYILELIRNHNLDAIQIKSSHPNMQTWYLIFNPDNKDRILKLNEFVYPNNSFIAIVLKAIKKSKIFNNILTKKTYKIFKS